MTLPLQIIKMGNQRYFDVYLDDPSSSDEEDNVDISRPLMSPRRYPRRSHVALPPNSSTPDTRLPKRRPVWYYKRKRDCLQAFYVVMIILVIIIFALVLARIIHDAATHRDEGDEPDALMQNTLHGLGNFAVGPPFVIRKKPTPPPPPPSKSKSSSSSSHVKHPAQHPAASPSSNKASAQKPPAQNPPPAGAKQPSEGRTPQPPPPVAEQRTVLPCSSFAVQEVWVQNIPQLMIESGIRLLDVNGDSVLDAIIGFATDVNAYFADEFLLCTIYFNGTKPCFGGVLALDGITGEELWRHYTSSEVFAVNCNGDVTGDGVNDCAIAGRAGVMEMVSGASGRGVWQYTPSGQDEAISNFYTAQFLHDVDDDGVVDILNIQGGDPVRKPGGEVRYSGKLMLMSGASGQVITVSEVPDGMESYYSPQIYYKKGGKGMVLFGTGGETIGGSLWSVPLDDLIDGRMDGAEAIYTDRRKGVMVPPALLDLTGDGVMDIIMSMFNTTIVALDGQTYQQLWNYTLPFSESYSTPAPAFYNDDDIPDFMVVYNSGPGYPLYYYAQVTILDGRNGQPLLQKPIISSGAVTTSPITISSEGYGRDSFFFWTLGCEGHREEVTPFEFENSEDSGIGALSKTDFCRERFNAATISSGNVLNQHMQPPGQEIYNSALHVQDEYRYTVNATILAMEFLKKYPEALQARLEAMAEHGSDGHHTLTKTQMPPPATTHAPSTAAATTAATTTLDFQSEYDLLLAKLANLSHALGKSPAGTPTSPSPPPSPSPSRSPGASGIDASPLGGTEGSQEDGIQPKVTTDYPAPSSTESARSTPTDSSKNSGSDAIATGVTDDVAPDDDDDVAPDDDDDIVDADIFSKLQELGFPESWINPQEVDGATHSVPLNDDARSSPDEDLTRAEVLELLESLLNTEQLGGNPDAPNTETRRRRDSRSEFGSPHTGRARSRRHAGLHDAEGIQRVISTGTLAPRLSPVLDDTPSDPNSIDVIFATYWFYPKDHEITTEKEKQCIKSWMEKERQRMDPSNEYYGLDHDAYGNLGSEHCKKKAKSAPTPSPEAVDPLNLYPFNLDAGEMTVYRLRLTCDCGLEAAQGSSPGARCSQILPHRQQQWGAYMGTYGNSYFTKRLKDLQ